MDHPAVNGDAVEAVVGYDPVIVGFWICGFSSTFMERGVNLLSLRCVFGRCVVACSPVVGG